MTASSSYTSGPEPSLEGEDREPASVRSAGDLQSAIAVTMLALLAYLVFPAARGWISSIVLTVPVRAVLAGLIAGVALRSSRWQMAVASAVLASILGAASLLAIPGVVGARNAILLTAGVVIAAVSAAGVRLAANRLRPRTTAALSLCAIVVFFGVATGVVPSPAADRLHQMRASLGQSHASDVDYDGDLYLLTYEYMKSGTSFYPAFAEGLERRGFGSAPSSPFSIREPWMWRAVAALPGASGLAFLGWFMVFAGGVSMSAWFFASTFLDPGASLLAPILVLSYYSAFTFGSTEFAFPDLWSAGLVLVALTLLVRERWLASVLMLIAAIAFRELAVVFIPAWIIAWTYASGARRDRLPTLVVLGVGPIAVTGLHVVSARPHLASDPQTGAAVWFVLGGLPRLIDVLTYGTGMMMVPSWLWPASLACALAGSLMIRSRWQRYSLVATFVAASGFLVLFGDSAYWGPLLQLPMLAGVSLVFLPLLPRADGAVRASAVREPRAA